MLTYSTTPTAGNLASLNQAISELNDWKRGCESWETDLLTWIENESFRLCNMAIRTLRTRKDAAKAVAKYEHLQKEAWIQRGICA